MLMHPWLVFVWALNPLRVSSQFFCTQSEWIADDCSWPNDGICDVPDYCSSNTDCADCDPCSAQYTSYGGCTACVAISGCAWCRHSGICQSATTLSLLDTDGNPWAPCDSGWEEDTCAAENNKVAGQSFNDPAAEAQRWYLEAINVGHAWSLGYTGAGVTIFFEDDALDITHPEFAGKFNLLGTPDPDNVMPDDADADQHGTACVGYAAAAANNSECGVGVAFNANISFAKFNNPDSLTVGVDNNVVHVHSNSWGISACASGNTSTHYDRSFMACPFNASATGSPCNHASCLGHDWMPGEITAGCVSTISSYCTSNAPEGQGLYDPACDDHWDLFVDCEHQGLDAVYHAGLLKGVTRGRNGLGIVYVFAAGNDFALGANINFEGWQNSIFTISVGATALDGKHSRYSSPGAAILISAPGGETGNGRMPTAVPSERCADGGQGTSYACPLVSGAVALMLEANPLLTWRDVQGILVRTAAAIDPQSSTWVPNGAGLQHSDWYGFGLLDVGAAVVMARDWPSSASSGGHAILVKYVSVDAALDSAGLQCGIEVTLNDSAHIIAVEHVVVYVTTAGHEARGDLEIMLTSPSGTTSLMAPARREDGSTYGNYDGDYENWKFMTVKNWGETAVGTWTLEVQDKKLNNASGSLASWSLAVYGACDSNASSCTKMFYAHSSMRCSDACQWALDDVCDDGGAGTNYMYSYYSSFCYFGTDCSDCGPRFDHPLFFDTMISQLYTMDVLTDATASCIRAPNSSSTFTSSPSSTSASTDSTSSRPGASSPSFGTSAASVSLTASPTTTSTSVEPAESSSSSHSSSELATSSSTPTTSSTTVESSSSSHSSSELSTSSPTTTSTTVEPAESSSLSQSSSSGSSTSSLTQTTLSSSQASSTSPASSTPSTTSSSIPSSASAALTESTVLTASSRTSTTSSTVTTSTVEASVVVDGTLTLDFGSGSAGDFMEAYNTDDSGEVTQALTEAVAAPLDDVTADDVTITGVELSPSTRRLGWKMKRRLTATGIIAMFEIDVTEVVAQGGSLDAAAIADSLSSATAATAITTALNDGLAAASIPLEVAQISVAAQVQTTTTTIATTSTLTSSQIGPSGTSSTTARASKSVTRRGSGAVVATLLFAHLSGCA